MDQDEERQLCGLRREYIAKAPLRRKGYYVAFAKPPGESWRLELGSCTREHLMRLLEGWAERNPGNPTEWVVIGPEAEDGTE